MTATGERATTRLLAILAAFQCSNCLYGNCHLCQSGCSCCSRKR